MKFLLFQIFPLVLLAGSSAVGQSRLPPCPSDTKAAWTDCQGTVTWPDGNKYVGEIRDGKVSGQGTFTWPDGSKYVGEFRDGKMNGQGIHTWPDGSKYVGEFRDDKMSGQGTRFAAGGRPQAQPPLGEQPPTADYLKGRVSARYERCNSAARNDYTTNWDSNCRGIHEREQTNYERCLAEHPGNQYNNDPWHCGRIYRRDTPPKDCRLPTVSADVFSRELARARDLCLKQYELGFY
jgi:hypothetical protein